MLTVGQVAENCFVVRRGRRRPRLHRRPGRRARSHPSAVEGLGIEVEAILLTHCHFDHIGAVGPVAAATGAPVYCPELEAPVLADIMSYVPWPGFGPFESYEADQKVCRRREARARRLRDRRPLHPRPQPRPRDLRDPRRAALFLRRRPLPGLGRPRRPARAATGRRCSRASAAWSTAYPRRDDRLPGPHGAHDARRRARRRTPSWPRSHGRLNRHRRATSRPRAGTLDVLPADAARFAAFEAAARSCSSAAGYGRIETPAFEHTELFARGVGESTDVVQKEMFTFERPAAAAR